MAASETSLLIIERPRWRLRIEPFDEIAPGEFEAPLQWVVFKRFRNAELLDASFRLSKVQGVEIRGIAGPGAWGGLDFSYLLILLFGWITLATPLIVRVRLSDTKLLDLDEARTYVNSIVDESGLFPDQIAELSQRIKRSKTVAAMARAIDRARE